MPGLLADINVQGQVELLRLVLESSEWADLWASLQMGIATFAEVGLDRRAPDVEVWRLCQQRGLFLVTGNRNHDGEDSLEATIQRENTAESLPVFTLADPERVRHSRAYAEQAAVRLLDYLHEIDKYRGTGRLYIP
jgi:hypothetical protein